MVKKQKRKLEISKAQLFKLDKEYKRAEKGAIISFAVAFSCVFLASAIEEPSLMQGGFAISGLGAGALSAYFSEKALKIEETMYHVDRLLKERVEMRKAQREKNEHRADKNATIEAIKKRHRRTVYDQDKEDEFSSGK